MNKKFLSAILFGALMVSSTSTFVSCKDYDDDVNSLQEQIDKNASAAANELASKVAALEAQLNALESAKTQLTTDLAAAKTEAATASANALAAAQAAQAAAVKAQGGADDAKAAAVAAQATADQAAKDLISAVARVSTLESKVSALESAVAELKQANSEFTSKLATLENSIKANADAIATNKNGIAENKQAIADANAAILAKATELNNSIVALSSQLGAKIDVINAELNTIKANYATKDELNSKYQELVAMDAQLKSQIDANNTYITNLQATVKDLAAKDNELAAKIESNYSSIIEKLNETNQSLTAASKQITALETTVSTLQTQYTSLQSTKADVTYVDNINRQLTSLITSLQSTLKDLTTSDAAQAQTINTLLQDVSALKDKTKDLQNLVDANKAAASKEVQDAISQLQGEIATAATNAQTALDAAVSNLQQQISANAAAIESIKLELAKKADQTALDALAASLLSTQTKLDSLAGELTNTNTKIASTKTELQGEIAAAQAAAQDYAQEIVTKLSENVDANTENIKNLNELMSQLLNISNKDLSAFVTKNEMSTAIEEAITEFYNNVKGEFLGETEFVEYMRAFKGDLVSNYVTNDALTQKLAGYVDTESYRTKMEALDETNKDYKTRIEALEDYMEDLGLVNKAISKRLTSITLVPSSYVEGIEAIVFKSLTYQANNRTYYLTNNTDTKAVYRMNPSGVTLDCIDVDNVKYVANQASNTRASVESPIVVTDCKLDGDGDLVVSMKKKDNYKNTSFGLTGDKFTIAALTLPINKEYWTVEDENAVVYSEYTRLAEKTFTPILAKKNDAGTYRHLYNLSDVQTSDVNNNVYQYITYTDTLNMMDIVRVCEDDAAHSVCDYESYGLKIVFDLQPTSYIQGSNQTDQQKFAYIINDTLLASCVYDNGKLLTKNSAAVDREPIVRVRLIDKNNGNNVVSTKYFKVKWTKTAPVDLGEIKSFNAANVGCDGQTVTLNTAEMNQMIYAQVGKDGISSTTFHAIYTDDNLTNTGNGTVTVKTDKINGVTSYNLQWTVTQAELIAAANSATHKLTAICKWTSIDGSGDITFTLTMSVKPYSFYINEASSYNSAYWRNSYTSFVVNPIAYGNNAAKATSTINIELVGNGFSVNNAPCTDLKNVIKSTNFGGSIETAEIVFDANACKTTYGNTASVSSDGKTLSLGGAVAAKIVANGNKQTLVLQENVEFDASNYGNTSSSATDAAKKLIGTDIPVKIGIETCVGEDIVKSYTLAVTKPLEINKASEGLFYESKNGGSEVNVSDALTLTDWNVGTGNSGYIVANKIYILQGEKYQYARALYNYYKVSSPVWNIGKAYTNLVGPNMTVGNTNNGANKGKLPDGAALTLSINGNQITYKTSGQGLGFEYKIYIPVTVTYKWGTLTKDVEFTVKPGSGID